MSRTSTTTLLAAAFLVVGMGSAQAEMRPGAFTFTPLVGGYLFEGNQELDDDPLIGAALGFDFSKFFGAEAMFNYIDTEHELLGNDIDAYVYHLDGLFYFWPGEKLAPYLAVGGGGITFNPVGAGSDTDWLVDYGLGLKYFITQDLALRGDVRHLISFDDTFNNLSYAVGFTYHWGGAREVPMARAEAPPEPERIVTREPERKVEPPQREVCVYLDVFFDFDRAEIKPPYQDELGKIAEFMKANPDVEATIKGYTDYIGTEEYNQKLSERRAESIKNYLVDNFGIDAGRISTVGLGETRPLATNETAYGRQLNRRASEVICTFQVVFR